MARSIRNIPSFLVAQSRSYWRYGLSPPLFKWYLSAIALLSVVSVTGVMALTTADTKAARNVLIQTSGAEALTETELTGLVVKEKLIAYWLGPISGSKYTLVANRAGRVTISYLSSDLGIDMPAQRNLVLETTGYGRGGGVLVFADTEIDNATDSTVTGNTFSYNRLVMNHMTVQIKDGEHHVLVIYPQARTPLSMQTDAEALERIR